MRILLAIIFSLCSLSSLYGKAAPFHLPRELISMAPKALRTELKKHKTTSDSYTRIAMQILEERIKLRMKLLDFTLVHEDAVKGMDSADNYKVQEQRINLNPVQRKKIFRDRNKLQLMTRYNKSYRIRSEAIRLFQQCKPYIPENRFHSEFLSLLEFQHIYLEQQILHLRNTLR